MAPQSSNTILGSFLCSGGGSVASGDHQQYRCYPTVAQSMPTCAQENIAGFHKRNFQSSNMPSVPKMPSCTPDDQYSSRKKKSRSRRVSFIYQVSVREIPSLRDYSAKELSDLYMSREEMSDSHLEAWRLVDLMNSGIEYEDHDGFSKRGLIDLKDDSVDRRKKIRDQTYQIVFGVQQFHSSNRRPPACMDVDEITASLYHKAAAQATEEAIEAAWFDAVAVRM
eukprot:CAMPEP_0116145136 /NCGR_PEP_ID=MMETSP0329-20121206/16412_1 /TAXON_ID=697910 /ORGANISM="Pseudo-nitzschia arenysensis, Strain B593" /LENGTH=223 /DNA_ID=CAMNT_0003640681 /DNA_START=25 /DNA_END=696 /DNA_ORIENTATION=+